MSRGLQIESKIICLGITDKKSKYIFDIGTSAAVSYIDTRNSVTNERTRN